MDWEDYKAEFAPDGTTRLVYIKDVGLSDWQTFFDFLRTTEAELDYFSGEQPASLPIKIADVVADKARAHRLVIGLGDVALHCRFRSVREIELEFDAAAIDSEGKARVVFRLMSTVGRTLSKEVFLVAENNKEHPIFAYVPGTGVQHRPSSPS